jgi:hypothetical protein
LDRGTIAGRKGTFLGDSGAVARQGAPVCGAVSATNTMSQFEEEYLV